MDEEISPKKPESLRDQLIRLRLPLGIGAVSILLVVISLVLLIKSVQTTTPIKFSHSASPSGEASGQASSIAVDVEGAVARPGVYRLPAGARVEEAIKAAGGLSSEADVDQIAKTINLATKLVDGAKLYIPKKGDSPASNIVRRESTVSINSASQSELEALPGVGPAIAQKIIASRPYQVLTELVTKKAMSQSLFDKLKDRLTL
ncbi:ComEA family DNA-binding protein [Candidatus Gottesmanbacteria bacterium]|nr:ComEA family DNA-binding protein [Candidatus Gottesmanbacteria bacterium]